MKKLLGTLALAAISFAGFSQDSIKMKDANMQPASLINDSTTMKNCLLMKDGQVMAVKAGQKSKLERTMTLDNGTTVAPDGMVTMTSGKTKMLKEGEWIDMKGKMGKLKMGKQMDGSDSTSMQ